MNLSPSTTRPDDTAAPVENNTWAGEKGLTKREIFAMTVLPGLVVEPTKLINEYSSYAQSAVWLADALIEALNRPKP